MEDLEMKHALRRYVETEEPPFSLTANALISQARRRHRWRVGLGIGAGGAATALSIVSTIALVPVGGGGPVLGQTCDVRLPLTNRVIRSLPSAIPVPPPEYAVPTAIVGTPGPSREYDPSQFPYDPPTAQPTPAFEPSPTAEPSPGADDGLWRPPPVLPPPSQERLDHMSCFLKHRMVQLLPDARFVPQMYPPMEVVWVPFAIDGTGWYRAIAFAVHDSQTCLIEVTVFRGNHAMAPGIWPRNRQPSADDQYVTAVVKTGASSILVTVEGGVITGEQALALANAPELDLYR